MTSEDSLPRAPEQADGLQRTLERLKREFGGAFIYRMMKVLPPACGDLPSIFARFHLELYAPGLYDEHGVDFPAHIRNSVAKRQAEFIAGRLCARSVLAVYGQAQHQVAIGASREPLWPSGFVGSITHNGQYAAAIACPRQQLLGVGIDIETVITDEARSAMIALVVNADEAALLRRCVGTLGFDSLLTLVFSAKESFFKAAFAQVGTYFDFDAVRVQAVDTTQRILRLRCTDGLGPELPAGRLVDVHFDVLDSASVFTVVVLKRAPVSIMPSGAAAPSFTGTFSEH